MLILLGFLLVCCISGNSLEVEESLIYIPQKAASTKEEDGARDSSYCYRFTWLGEGLDKNEFPNLENKTCVDYFGKDDPRLCIDPMVVTEKGGKPDLDIIRRDHFKEAVCKLSEDRVCAKYTIYYNGVASRVVRFCTRIDVESEGPLRSGCLTAKNGSYAYEICACTSGRGEAGICNSGARNDSSIIMSLNFFVLSLLVFDRIRIR